MASIEPLAKASAPLGRVGAPCLGHGKTRQNPHLAWPVAKRCRTHTWRRLQREARRHRARWLEAVVVAVRKKADDVHLELLREAKNIRDVVRLAAKDGRVAGQHVRSARRRLHQPPPELKRSARALARLLK
jgi:hypothetical protein